MKKFKNITLFLLTLLYCFAAGMSGHSAYGAASSKVPLQQEDSFSKITAKFATHIHTEQFKLTDVSAEKKFCPGYKPFLQSAALICYPPDTFTQYTLYSQDFLLRFGKPDIIFPFHYFW